MTARVPEWYPSALSLGSIQIAEPYSTRIIQKIADSENHLLGSDLPEVHHMAWGSSEATTATYRFLYQAHPNVRALLFAFIPRGHVSSGAAYGTIAVSGADLTPQRVTQRNADITDLGDLAQELVFVRPVTADTFAEITYTVTDVRLHSVCVWEMPRGQLSGTQKHVDRSISWHDRFITDAAVGGSNPRGHPQILQSLDDARVYSRRHVTPFVSPIPTATNPGLNNVWTDVTGWDNLRLRGRAVRGSATADRMTFRAFIYAAVTGGATFEFRMVGVATSGASAGFGGAAAWRPGSAALSDGVSWLVQDTALETVKVQCQRTAGAGTLEVNALNLIEAPV